MTAVTLLGAAGTFVAGSPGLAWSAPQPQPLALSQSEAALPAGTVGDPSALPGQIEVSVALKPRDPAGADTFVSEVSDPASPLYHHFLTSAQYTERFGPTQRSVDAVSSYLAGKGLRVLGVSGNRQVVTAVGSPSAVGAAMSVTIAGYRSASGQKFYEAPGKAPALPSNLAGAVRSVTGLTNRFSPHHASAPAGPVGQGGGYTPGQFKTAYGMTKLAGSYDGTGQSVGITEFDTFKQSDLNAFAQAYNLPSVTPTQVAVDGGVSSPGGDQLEVTLDVEAVAGMAPHAAQYVYEAPNSDQAWVDEMAKIASDDKIDILTNSWLNGEKCESAPISASHDSYTQMASQGITLLSASGDWGGTGCGYQGDNSTVEADFPPSDPLFTGVGGTTLHTGDSAGTYSSESCWNQGSSGNTRSGGGYSSLYATPDYQKAVNTTGNRSVPDVALDADYGQGAYSVYMNGGWQDVGGTSLSAPIWAGYIAMVDQKALAAGKSRVAAINPTIYSAAAGSSYGSLFHDVTSGGNGTYNAGTGYDLCTGWGSPIGDALSDTLLGGSQPPPANDFSVTLNPTSVSIAAGRSGTVTVNTATTAGASQTVSLAASGLPSGVTASFNPASVASGTSSTLTLTVASTAADATTSVTITGTGTGSGPVHSAQEALTVTGGTTGGGDFSISDSPASGSVVAGQSTSTTVSTVSTVSTAAAAGSASQPTGGGSGTGSAPGTGPAAQPGVVGGQPATVAQYPYMISMRRQGSAFPGQQSCSMALVGPHTAVGAAHCWLEKSGTKWFVYGATNLSDTGFTANIASVWTDPRYTDWSQGHDVAIFTLDRDVPVPAGIVYPKINTDPSLNAPGTMGMGIGWGETAANTYSQTLQTVNFPVAQDSACADQSTLSANWKGDGSMLCTGYADGHAGVCVGDSGSPYIVNGTIVGIFSWMSLNCDTYDVYARVSTYANEINQQLNGGTTGGGSINLAASGLPSGATATFNPASVNAGSSSTLSIATSASTPAGTYTVTITGDNGTNKHSTTFSLTVTPSQNGQLTVNNPGPQSTPVGAQANLQMTASGGTAPYIWFAQGLPPGLSINASTGRITGVDYVSGGPYQVTVGVFDNAGHQASTSFSWTIH